MKSFAVFTLSFLLAAFAFSRELSQVIINERYDYRSPLSQAVADRYAQDLKTFGKEYHVSWRWFSSLLCIENHFKEKGTDHLGSYGIAQMQVSTAQLEAQALGDDPSLITAEWLNTHPDKGIQYGMLYFRDLLEIFHGDYYWATRAYNAGDPRIQLAYHGNKKYKELSAGYYSNVYSRYLKLCGDLKKKTQR